MIVYKVQSDWILEQFYIRNGIGFHEVYTGGLPGIH